MGSDGALNHRGAVQLGSPVPFLHAAFEFLLDYAASSEPVRYVLAERDLDATQETKGLMYDPLSRISYPQGR